MKKRLEKKLLLSKETLKTLAGGELGQAAAGFTGPDCDSIEPWWSCTCPVDGTK